MLLYVQQKKYSLYLTLRILVNAVFIFFLISKLRNSYSNKGNSSLLEHLFLKN